jgi:nitrile hydratase accessory protein
VSAAASDPAAFHFLEYRITARVIPVDKNDRSSGSAGYVARRISADISSPAAIPRRNGEPVFNEPWESRIFGAAVALCERGVFEWDEFRERLIAEIASAHCEDSGTPRATYYESFLSAFERLLIDKAVCAKAEIDFCKVEEPSDDHHH